MTKEELEKLKAAKTARRLAAARLPIEEKIKILIRMQQMRYDLGLQKFKPWGQN